MSHQLSLLLNSLNGAEKRYCNLHLKTFSGKTQNNVLVNDYENISRNLKKNKSDKHTQITDGNSTRLYYKLIDALCDFHQVTLNPDEALFSRRARLLFSKGLYKEAYRLADKVIESNPQEHHLLKMETIELRMLNALKTSDIEYLKKEFKEDKVRLKNLSKEYFNLIEFELLWASFRLESTTSYFFGTKNTIKSPLLKSEENALTPFAKILFNKTNGFIAVKEGDYPAANFYANRAKLLYEQYPYLIEKDPGDYLRSVNNICLSLIFNKLYSEAAKLLSEFDSERDIFSRSKNAEVKTEFFSVKVLLRLLLAISNGEYKTIDYEIPELERMFEKYKSILPTDQKISSLLSFAIININHGNYRKAIKNLNYVIKHAEIFRKDLFHLALMAELSIHYLLGNVDLLESKLNSFKRHLNQEELPFGFEKDLPPLLNKIIQSPSEKSNFTDLHETIISSLNKENKFIYTNFITLLLLKPNK